MARLVFFEKWADRVAEQVIAGHVEIDLVRLDYAAPQDENWDELARAQGYQISPRGDIREPWFGSRELLERCPHLLAISSTGAGFDTVSVDACTEAGVLVCNQSGTNREAVAEHALGLLIALSKRITVTDKGLRRPESVDRFKFLGNDIFGKTVGIVGLGNIGGRVAELCNGLFAMNVLAYDPYLSRETISQRGATKVEFEELLQLSDYITVHCPRTDETLGLFGLSQFEMMKPTAFFINTARGGIHNEEGLAAALSQGRLSGAGLDVFVTEPPPHDHPLLAFDNVIATPHNAGITVEATHSMAKAAAEQWITIFRGGVPPRLINPEAWDRYRERFNREFGFWPMDRASPKRMADSGSHV